MKKFKTKTIRSHHGEVIILAVIILVFALLSHYNKKITPKLLDIATTKLEEITNIYIKNNIVPENVNLDKLIDINKNKKDEILFVDINTTYANEIMVSVVKKIQKNIFDLEINDNILKKREENMYLKLPLFIADDGVLLSNLGPKIPVKLTFYEHAFGNIEVELNEYGINNAIIKIFLDVSLEQKLYIPYKEEKFIKTYRLLIGSKVINGTVPSIYGGSLNKVSTSLNTV